MFSATLHLRMMLHRHFLLRMLRAHLLDYATSYSSYAARCSTSGSGHFAGVRFALVSARVSLVPLISGLQVVSVCSGFSCSCSLKITFSYVARFVSSFSRTGSCCCSSLALTPG